MFFTCSTYRSSDRVTSLRPNWYRYWSQVFELGQHEVEEYGLCPYDSDHTPNLLNPTYTTFQQPYHGPCIYSTVLFLFP